jgi:hypothetical protein
MPWAFLVHCQAAQVSNHSAPTAEVFVIEGGTPSHFPENRMIELKEQHIILPLSVDA